MDNTAFFYGTLMAPGVLYRVIYGDPNPKPVDHPAMKSLKIRPAMLHNHRRHKVIGADYPAILAEEGGCVRGTVVSGLTEGDMWRLDIFEGTQYERRWVKVKVLRDVKLNEAAPEPNGKVSGNHAGSPEVAAEVEAQTYIWFSSPEELEPSEWDFEEFKREKMDMWMGLSSWGEKDEGFDDVDRAVAELETRENKAWGSPKEDGMGGRGVNGHIGKQLTDAQNSDAA